MLWFLLLLSGFQTPAPTVDSSDFLPTPPTGEAVGRCLAPLARERADATLVVECESVQNGQPRDCRLSAGEEQSVRQRTAARCLARLYRYTDANGQPATGGAVTIPITLRVNLDGPSPRSE